MTESNYDSTTTGSIDVGSMIQMTKIPVLQWNPGIEKSRAYCYYFNLVILL